MWNQTYDSDCEPITCVKCEMRFNTEIERKKHEHAYHTIRLSANITNNKKDVSDLGIVMNYILQT
jgi:hypothetical protein